MNNVKKRVIFIMKDKFILNEIKSAVLGVFMYNIIHIPITSS
jgi:hypothetical protein